MAELVNLPLFNDANIVSYWRMEGNSNDSKGSNNGTDTGITYNAVKGKFNQGAGFNGTSSFISVGTAVPNFTNGFSFVAHCMPLGAHGGGYGGLWHDQRDATRSRLLINDNGSVLAQFNINGVDGSFASSAGVVISNSYNSVIYTYNGSQEKIYVNSILVASQNTTGNMGTSAGARIIGRGSSATYYFNGNVDDVAIFSRALTQAEVILIHNPGGGFFGFL